MRAVFHPVSLTVIGQIEHRLQPAVQSPEVLDLAHHLRGSSVRTVHHRRIIRACHPFHRVRFAEPYTSFIYNAVKLAFEFHEHSAVSFRFCVTSDTELLLEVRFGDGMSGEHKVVSVEVDVSDCRSAESVHLHVRLHGLQDAGLLLSRDHIFDFVSFEHCLISHGIASFTIRKIPVNA